MAELNRLLEKLLAHKFSFVLVGGFAGVVHGSSQLTRDVDICMDLNPLVIKRLRAALADLHPVHRQTPRKLSFLEHPSNLTKVRNLYLQTDLGPLDILSEIINVGGFQTVADHAVTIDLYNHDCLVMNLDDLISSKKALGREKDRSAIVELQLIREKKSGRG